jgi:hypothetical protein
MGSHFLGRWLGGLGGGHHGGRHRGRRDYGYDSLRNGDGLAPLRVLVCPECRADNTPNSRFCAQCGKQMVAVLRA